MATNWKVLTGAAVVKVVARLVVNKSQENTGPDVEAGAPFDEAEENRADEIMRMVVDEFRGAIEAGGRMPVSLTEQSVPPDCELDALNYAAYQLFNSIPNLQMVVLTEKGAVSPFAKFYDKAIKRLAELREGAQVVAPTDPTGEDYLTAVGPDNPAVCGVSWSDMRMTDREYEAGTKDALDMTTD